jgi:hypothetical protein
MTGGDWWRHPFRVFQTNLREIDAGLDAERTAETIAGLGANAWLLNTGGIVSFYPSALPFQHPSPWLAERPSGDLIGDAVTAAHQRGIALISRMDFSKVHEDIAQANADWCFVGADGAPQIYNGLYSVCPSGPYYQERAFEIIGEVLDHYPVDGFFFNWFNFNQRDYSGLERGICQCYNCKRRFRESSGMTLPSRVDWSDPAFLAWNDYVRATLGDLAQRIRELVHERRPEVPLMLRQSPDVIMHEANNAIDRTLPLWVESAAEMARHSRGDDPATPVWVNTVTFVDMPYRFAAEQAGFIALDLVQTFAYGANPSSYIIGTPDMADTRILETTRELLHFHRDNAEYYDTTVPAARVLLVSSLRTTEKYGGAVQERKVRDEFRGCYRALAESHVPFDVISDSRLADAADPGRLARYDVVVLPNVAILDGQQAAVLDNYVSAGGGLVASYDTGLFDEDGRELGAQSLASLGFAQVRFRREAREALRGSYLLVDDPGLVPGTGEHAMLAMDDAFLHCLPREGASGRLPFLSPQRYGPPEKSYGGVRTGSFGRIDHRYGRGGTVSLPWPVGGLYYRWGLADYRNVLVAAIDSLLPDGRQLITSAPAQVEASVSAQPGSGRTLIHLINRTGHQGRAFFEPVELAGIRLEYRDPHATCMRAVRAGLELETRREGDRLVATLPTLGLFELISIE